MNGKHLPLRWNHARAAVESFCWLEMVDDDRPNVALQPSCREALKQPWSDEQNIERSLRKEFGRTIRVAGDVEALAVPGDEIREMRDPPMRGCKCFGANVADLPTLVEIRQRGVIDLGSHVGCADDDATDLFHKRGSEVVRVCVRGDADRVRRCPDLVRRIGHVTKRSGLVREINIYGSFPITDCEGVVTDKAHLQALLAIRRH